MFLLIRQFLHQDDSRDKVLHDAKTRLNFVKLGGEVELGKGGADHIFNQDSIYLFRITFHNEIRDVVLQNTQSHSLCGDREAR